MTKEVFERELSAVEKRLGSLIESNAQIFEGREDANIAPLSIKIDGLRQRMNFVVERMDQVEQMVVGLQRAIDDLAKKLGRSLVQRDDFMELRKRKVAAQRDSTL